MFVEALISKCLVLLAQGRLAEARILLEAAASRAHAEELYVSELRAGNNLEVVLEASDRYAEAVELAERLIALARRRGDRRWESSLRTAPLHALFLLGRWDEAVSVAAEELPLAATEVVRGQLVQAAPIHCERGELEPAEALLAAAETLRDTDQSELRAAYATAEARLLRARGRPADALAAAERALALSELSISQTPLKLALAEATEAALVLADFDKAEQLLAVLEALDPGQLTPFLRANAARLRARLDAARGSDDQVDERFRRAAAVFREFGFVFHLAVTQLEHAEWLAGQGRADEAEPLIAGAAETFEHLDARPWLDRLAGARAGPRSEIPA